MRSVELFAGAGGLGLGLESAGFKPDLVVEWDADSCRTLLANRAHGLPALSGWNVLHSDARLVDYSSIACEPALVSGGPPCQPFSIGGKHKGQNDNRNMWPEAVRAVRELSPRAFLFENVRGLLRPSFKQYLRYIELQLTFPEKAGIAGESWEDHLLRLEQLNRSNSVRSELTYRVSIHAVNAADFGAAQKRRRVIFVGFRYDQEANWTAPLPTHSSDALFWDKWVTGEYWDRHRIPIKSRPAMPVSCHGKLQKLQREMFTPPEKAWRTLRDAIGDLPPPTKNGQAIPNHRLQEGAKSYVGHTGSTLDEPAKALKAGDHGVPGGENMIAFSDGSVRYLSVREAARLQGFPDEFRFPDSVSWSESMRQLGNAVPTQLARAFGLSIATALLGGSLRKKRAA